MTCVKHCHTFPLTNEFEMHEAIFFALKLASTGLRNVNPIVPVEGNSPPPSKDISYQPFCYEFVVE